MRLYLALFAVLAVAVTFGSWALGLRFDRMAPATFLDEHGTTWELILDNKSLNQKLCAQTSGYGKRIVYRDDAVADCGAPQGSVMHELMHVCQWNAGIQANDEMIVHRVIYMEAPCLYSIERSNPRLTAWLSR